MRMVTMTITDTDTSMDWGGSGLCMVTPKRKARQIIGILVRFFSRRHREVDADANTQVLQLGTTIHSLTNHVGV